MKRYKLSLSSNPSFNTVTGLTNTTFDSINYVENRMATEQQISDLYNRIVEQERRRDECCRDIIVWEAHTQIVRLNNNNISTAQGNYFNSPGVVISTWDENVSTGTMRRGLAYSIEFPIKWDDSLYYPVTPERAYDSTICSVINNYSNSSQVSCHHKTVQFRWLEDSDNIYGPNRCTTSSNNRSDFFAGNGASVTAQGAVRNYGYLVNSCRNWGSFTLDVKNDGTITIRDNRRNTNYNIIRFYTQLTLNRCANGSLLSDKESEIFPSGKPDTW